MKPPTWATCLEQVWTQVSHLQAYDSGKLSRESGYAPARFGLGKTGCASRGPSQSILI
jgi:hypothetical protein